MLKRSLRFLRTLHGSRTKYLYGSMRFLILFSLFLSQPLLSSEMKDVSVKLEPTQGHTGTIYTLTLVLDSMSVWLNQKEPGFEDFKVLSFQKPSPSIYVWHLIPLKTEAKLPISWDFLHLDAEVETQSLTLPVVEVRSAWAITEKKKLQPLVAPQDQPSWRLWTVVFLAFFIIVTSSFYFFRTKKKANFTEPIAEKTISDYYFNTQNPKGSYKDLYVFLLNWVATKYKIPQIHTLGTFDLASRLEKEPIISDTMISIIRCSDSFFYSNKIPSHEDYLLLQKEIQTRLPMEKQ